MRIFRYNILKYGLLFILLSLQYDRYLRPLKQMVQSFEINEQTEKKNITDSQLPKFYSKKRLEAAIIIDELKGHTVKSKRRITYVRELAATLFDQIGKFSKPIIVHSPAPSYNQSMDDGIFEVKKWPALYVGDCADVFPIKREGKAPGADRSMTLAHYGIWDQFLRRRETNKMRQMFNETNDVMAVFEDDFFPMAPNIGAALIAEIDNMKTDILYLGWCFHYEKDKAPCCTHAYAVNVIGARKLMNSIDTCHLDPNDIQMRKTANNISWSMSSAEKYDPKGAYFKKAIKENEVTVPTILYAIGFGGIFAQVMFAPSLDNTTLPDNQIVKAPGKTVYVWNNGSLHSFPDQNTFVKMGFDFDQKMVISEHQLKSLPVGDPVASII